MSGVNKKGLSSFIRRYLKNKPYLIRLERDLKTVTLHAHDKEGDFIAQLKLNREISFTGFADTIKQVFTKKYGKLEVIGGDFRQETIGNSRVSINFDPWGGTFSVHIEYKK